MKLTVTLVEARGLPLSTGRKPPHSYALLRARAEARPWSFERTRTVYSSRSPRWAKAVQVEVPAMAQFIEGEVSIVAASSREGDEPLATAKFTIAPVAERGARADAPSAAGLTPADAARSRGHDAIASALTAVCEKQKYTESVERRNPTKKYAAL